MANTIKGIKAIIKSKIESIKTDDVSIFKVITDKPTAQFDGYPAVVIRPTGWSGDRIDTHRIERKFTFELDLYYEYGENSADVAEAQETMESVSDMILQAFDQDNDLGQEVEVVNVVSGSLDFTNRPGVTMFATFLIECLVLVDGFSSS